MADNSNTKTKIASGFAWRFFERILAQLVTFVVAIVLARILGPDSYGEIAIVNIFITLANVFVTAGFGSSLIQKKEADETDFSTVFYAGIVLGIVFYVLIFVTAPLVASFYNLDVLSPVLRVMGLKLILAAVNSVQQAYVSRQMMFQRFFWATLGGTLSSAVVGITMAYMGFGVWSLVAQYMFNSLIDTIILWFTVRWRPKWLFSFERLKSLFSYGWKILVASLVRTGYNETRSLVIGKVYAPTDLAFYNKGRSFPSMVVTNIFVAIQSVIFPTMAKVQDDITQLKAMTRRLVRIHSYTILPLLLGLSLVAEPLIELLLTEKWLTCVPFLQAFCIVSSFEPIQTANLQAIKAIGRSDVYLKLEIAKKLIGIIAIIISVRYGVWAIALGEVIVEFFAALLNIYPNKKLINYSYIEQLRDLMNAFTPLLLMVITVLCVGLIPMGTFVELTTKVLLGAIAYIGSSYLLKNDSLIYLFNLVVKRK